MGGMSKCGHVDRREAARSGQREWQVRKRRGMQKTTETKLDGGGQHNTPPHRALPLEQRICCMSAVLVWGCAGIAGESLETPDAQANPG